MAIYTAKRRDEKLGVLFIDLDRFKNINDSLGHSVGDQILKEAAVRLNSAVRSEDTVARLGGDEFVVLLPKIKVDTDLADVASYISSILQAPYEVAGISLHITPSMGIAVYPDDGGCPDELIKNSDAAMYLAKEKGRNNFQFYTPSLNAKALDRLRLESDFRQSLINGDFELYYQPQVKGLDNSLWGVEALIRWRHPQRGLVSPIDFIPLAEETGLIIALGEWVLLEALKQQKKWQLQGFPRLVMSVNISALQFKQVGFLERVKLLLETVGADPRLVELELTESMLMSNMEASIKLIKAFGDLGFRTAIDDFGTGFSSLNYLRKLPVDVLKIDQSFVRDMLLEPASLAIVDSVINLAHALGKETVAEGVETLEEYQLLCQRGCRLIQGYYIARPMPAAAFDEWLLRYNS
jgi:diguanylate cyclase (GGDEF)-like protein